MNLSKSQRIKKWKHIQLQGFKSPTGSLRKIKANDFYYAYDWVVFGHREMQPWLGKSGCTLLAGGEGL